jgi:hypothetical protein
MLTAKGTDNLLSDPTQSYANPGETKTQLWISDQDKRPPSVGRSPLHGGTPLVRITPPGQHVQRRLLKLVRKRIKKSDPPTAAQVLRFPVALIFTRDRGAAGTASIRDEIASSFEFWSRDSGEHFDMFFPGWYFHNGKLRFNLNRFEEYRKEIERVSSWKYSGETDLLILNFDYTLQTGKAQFAFDEVIILPVEDMIREKRIGSFAVLLSYIHNAARKSRNRGKHSKVWEMSDGIGFLRGRQSLWEALKTFVLKDFAQVYDKVRPFGVVDLRRHS